MSSLSDIVDLVRKLFSLLPKRGQRHALLLLGMMAVGALLEGFGIGLFLPFLGLLSEPESYRDYDLLRWFDDLYEFEDASSFLFFAAAGLLAIYVIKNIYLALMHYVLFRFIYSNFVELSTELYERYLRAPYVVHTQQNSSALLRNIRQETLTVFGTLFMQCFSLFIELSVICVLIGLLIVVEPILAPIAVAAFGLVGAIFYAFVRTKITALGEVRQESLGQMIQWVNQGLGGVKESQVLGREIFFVNAYRDASINFSTASRYYRLVQVTPRFFLETVGMGGMLVVLLVMLGQGRSLAGLLPVLGLFGMAAVRLMPSITRIVSALNSLRHYRPALDVVWSDMEQYKTAVTDLPEPPRTRFSNSIGFHDVSFRYPNTRETTIEGLSFKIEKGERVAFVGDSGCGKTTTVDIILGLLLPSEGQVLIDGQPLNDVRRWWQDQVGYIAQPTYLTDDTLRRNVAFGVPDEEIDEPRVERALRIAALWDFALSLPDGLDTLVGEHGVRFSGGQRQRIGIARAMYHSPGVVVLDEATSALDASTEQEITDAIYALDRETTIILVAHRLTTVRNCDKVFYLRDGALVDTGRFEELVDKNEEFARLVAIMKGRTRSAESEDQL